MISGAAIVCTNTAPMTAAPGQTQEASDTVRVEADTDTDALRAAGLPAG